MREFAEIFEIAAARKGGAEAIEARLSKPLAIEELAAIGDDRWLSMIARCVFQAGFSWKVIDAKWPGFEAAFDSFDPPHVARFGLDEMERLLSDRRIVRHGTKIRSVIDNAALLVELAGDHGSAGAFFAGWPDEDYVGLVAFLGKRGARLGGMTGQRVLRSMGKSSFVVTPDVTRRLIEEGIVEKPPTSRRDMTLVQNAFNTWSQQSGRSLTEISQVLAMSVGV